GWKRKKIARDRVEVRVRNPVRAQPLELSRSGCTTTAHEQGPVSWVESDPRTGRSDNLFRKPAVVEVTVRQDNAVHRSDVVAKILECRRQLPRSALLWSPGVDEKHAFLGRDDVRERVPQRARKWQRNLPNAFGDFSCLR